MSKKELCPACGTEMGLLPSDRERVYYCEKCGTHVDKTGAVSTLDDDCELQQIGYVVAEKGEEELSAMKLDFYFVSKDKKTFNSVVRVDKHPGLVKLTKRDGSIILINWDNVNFAEQS